MKQPENLLDGREYCQVKDHGYQYVQVDKDGQLWFCQETTEFHTNETVTISASDNGIMCESKNGEVNEVYHNTYSVNDFVDRMLTEKHAIWTAIPPRAIGIDDYRKLMARTGMTELVSKEGEQPF